MAKVTAAGMGVSVTQLVTIIGVIVAVITALIFEWPAKIWQAVLRWRGQRPIAVSYERVGIDWSYPQQSLERDDQNPKGRRSVVLHFYNHAAHDRHVLITGDSELLGVREGHVESSSFWMPGNKGGNVVLNLYAPVDAWTPNAELRLKGSTDAGEKIRWSGKIAPIPLARREPMVFWGPPPG